MPPKRKAAEPTAAAAASKKSRQIAKETKPNDSGPTLTTAQSRIVGSFLRTVFDTDNGPNQWDEERREKIAEQCNDELEKQGEARVYSAVKLHFWVGNTMYRHRQALKKAQELRLNPPKPKPKKGKPETAVKKKKRLAEEAALRRRALDAGVGEKDLPKAQEGDVPGELKSALIELIMDQELGAEGDEENASSEPKLQQNGVGGSAEGGAAAAAPPSAARQALRQQLESIDSVTRSPVPAAASMVEQITAQHQAAAAAAAAVEAEKRRWAEVRASAARAAAAAAAAPQASREASAAADAAYAAQQRANEARKRERQAHDEAAAAAAAAVTVGPPPCSLLDPVHPMVLLGGQVEEQAYIKDVVGLMKLAQHEVPPAEIHRPDSHNPRVYTEADARGDGSGMLPAKVFSGDSQTRMGCPVIFGLASAPFEPIYTRVVSKWAIPSTT